MSKSVRIDIIDRSPWADLFDHDEENIAALAEDIQARGIQTPLQVYPRNGRYELLTGHDRLEAAKRVGLREVPCDERSTLSDEDARFRHFIADNTQRKGVNKRRIARAVLSRAKGDISNAHVARLVRCDDHTVAAVREELLATSEIPRLEKTTGSDGKARTTTPAKPPKATEQLRKRREQQAPEASPYFETKPQAEPRIEDEERGVDVPAAMEAFKQERKAEPFLKVQTYISHLPIAPDLSDAEMDEAIADDRFHFGLQKQAGFALQFLARIQSRIKNKSEVRSA